MPQDEVQQPEYPSMDDYAEVRDREPDDVDPTPAAPEPEQDASESGTDEPPLEPSAPAQPTPEERSRRSVQKRFDELTRRAAEAERRADMLLESQKALLGRQEQPQRQTPQAPAEDAPPREEDFPGDYRAFLQAEAKFAARQEVESRLQRAENERQQQERQRTEQERAAQHIEQVGTVMRQFEQRTADFAKTAPDYDATVEALDAIPIGPHNSAMVQTLLMRPDSASVLYHMGKNPKVAEQISRMPPALQGAAIGEFAANIARSAQHTNAPPPGRPVGSRAASGSSTPPTSGSMDDYAAWRRRNSRS